MAGHGFGPDFYNLVLDKAREPLADLTDFFAQQAPRSQPTDALPDVNRNAQYRQDFAQSPIAQAFYNAGGGTALSAIGSTVKMPGMSTLPYFGPSVDTHGAAINPRNQIPAFVPNAPPGQAPTAKPMIWTPDRGIVEAPEQAPQSGVGIASPVASPVDDGSVISLAQQYIGRPYVFGSGPDDSSFDCSDYTQFVYGRLGVEIPRTAYTQFVATQSGDVPLEQAQPGDLIFFKDTYNSGTPGNISHVAIYMGNGKFIGAQGQDVNIGSLNSPYWSSKLAGVHHVPGVTNGAAQISNGDAQVNTVVPADATSTGENRTAQQPQQTAPGGIERGGQLAFNPNTPVWTMADSYSQQYGLKDVNVLKALILAESGGDPYQIGDNGNSVGLLQNNMHGGRGQGHSQESLLDPNYNIAISMPEISAAYRRALSEGYDEGTPEFAMRVGQIAQRPRPDLIHRYADAYAVVSRGGY